MFSILRDSLLALVRKQIQNICIDSHRAQFAVNAEQT